jgi:hypothetical protein
MRLVFLKRPGTACFCSAVTLAKQDVRHDDRPISRSTFVRQPLPQVSRRYDRMARWYRA